MIGDNKMSNYKNKIVAFSIKNDAIKMIDCYTNEIVDIRMFRNSGLIGNWLNSRSKENEIRIIYAYDSNKSTFGVMRFANASVMRNVLSNHGNKYAVTYVENDKLVGFGDAQLIVDELDSEDNDNFAVNINSSIGDLIEKTFNIDMLNNINKSFMNSDNFSIVIKKNIGYTIINMKFNDIKSGLDYYIYNSKYDSKCIVYFDEVQCIRVEINRVKEAYIVNNIEYNDEINKEFNVIIDSMNDKICSVYEDVKKKDKRNKDNKFIDSQQGIIDKIIGRKQT